MCIISCPPFHAGADAQVVDNQQEASAQKEHLETKNSKNNQWKIPVWLSGTSPLSATVT